MTNRVVAKAVRFSPVRHTSYSGVRTAWVVIITNLDGTESLCHGDLSTNHGHRTRQAAKDCVTREMHRRQRSPLEEK